MQRSTPNHYATLGLDRRCSEDQIRAAYRLLAKQHHPDVNGGSLEALTRTQALNAAYEILSDPVRRQAYDEELASSGKAVRASASRSERNIAEEVHLRLEEFFRGTRREVRVHDAGNVSGPELYELVVPPETAPGTRIKLERAGGGLLVIRLRTLPHFQFKARGSDLRCDLKINSKLAAQGGEQVIKNVLGAMLRVRIPARVARGEVLRLAGEGMPKPRGGRGDLLVRIMYRPEVRISRPGR